MDIKKVAEAACRYDKLLELNCSHYSNPNKLENVSIPATLQMIEIIQKNNHKLIINSDAHWYEEIGDDSALMNYRQELGFRDEDIINNDIDQLKRYFEI